MTRTRTWTRTRTRLLAVPAALAVTLGLAGCATGFDAATNQPYIPSNGTSFTSGTMDARNVLLVADPTKPDTYHLIGALVNSGNAPETLTAVSVTGASQVPLTPITVAGQSLVTTGAEPTSDILVTNAKFSVGDFTSVTLTFSTTGSVTRDVLAMTPEGTVSGG